VNGKLVHLAEDGTQTDVTEGVQALYDLCISSMDFRSGFWSSEDAIPVGTMARLCGFGECAEVERYVREALHDEESAAWRRDRREQIGPWYSGGRTVKHDHVFSSAGRCMWPACKEHAEETG
jgi:hypothetical protein